MKYIVIFSFIILFPMCDHRKGSLARENFLLDAVSSFSKSPRAFFSYPGRWENQNKKREALNTILELIKNTKTELIILAYSFNHPEIIEELSKAKNRGVKIDITLDKDKDYTLLSDAGIAFKLWDKSGLHHTKIILSDRNKFLFGTGNFSNIGMTNDWNGFIQLGIDSNRADDLISHFKEISDKPFFKTEFGKFYFSPQNGNLIQDTIIKSIEEANFSIKILAFDHSDVILTNTLKKASKRGVFVQEISNDPVDPEVLFLNKEFYGLNSRVYRDGNTDIIETSSFPEGGLLHHKTIIIDDKKLLTGSYNFSLNARDNNRELFFLSEDPYLVKEFDSEFERVKGKSYLLPRDGFNTNEKVSNLNNLQNTTYKLCFDDLNSPVIIEIGANIFKTYLYYDKLFNNCITKKIYYTISTGIATISSTSLDTDELWDEFTVYNRSGESVWKYSNSKNLFQTELAWNILELQSIDLSNSNKVLFTLKNKIPEISEIYYYSPNYTLKKASSFTTKDNLITMSLLISEKEKSKGAIILKKSNSAYMLCFKQKNYTDNKILEYLQNKINNQNSVEATPTCLEY